VLAMNRVLRVRSRFVSAICLKVERGDVAGAVVDEAVGDPAGSLHEARDLFARGEGDVMPGGRKLSVADAEALDAAHSSACPVACVVAAREFRRRHRRGRTSRPGSASDWWKRARASGAGGDPAAPQRGGRGCSRAAGSCRSARLRGPRSRAFPAARRRAPLPRNPDSERGDVNPDHLVPAALEVQADAPSAAEIEHPSAHEPHRATRLRPP